MGVRTPASLGGGKGIGGGGSCDLHRHSGSRAWESLYLYVSEQMTTGG